MTDAWPASGGRRAAWVHHADRPAARGPQRRPERSRRSWHAANLPDMRWHDLRHSCASILLAEGVSLATIQVILGHSQIAVTNQYAHLVPRAQTIAAHTMDAALTPVE